MIGDRRFVVGGDPEFAAEIEIEKLAEQISGRNFVAGRKCLYESLIHSLVFAGLGHDDPVRDDIRYIYSTFPIFEREERAKWDGYRSRDLCLAWINALIAGQPDAEVAR